MSHHVPKPYYHDYVAPSINSLQCTVYSYQPKYWSAYELFGLLEGAFAGFFVCSTVFVSWQISYSITLPMVWSRIWNLGPRDRRDMINAAINLTTQLIHDGG